MPTDALLSDVGKTEITIRYVSRKDAKIFLAAYLPFAPLRENF